MRVVVVRMSATSRPSASVHTTRCTPRSSPPPTAGLSPTRSTSVSSSTSRPTTTRTTTSAGPPGSASSRCPRSRAAPRLGLLGRLDTELGVLKTGKEADVFLVERAVRQRPDPVGGDGRQALPHRGAPFLPPQLELHRGRRTRNSRDTRALAKKTAHGRGSPRASGPGRSGRRSSAGGGGRPGPYPVQIDGTEILMEFVSVDGARLRRGSRRPARAATCSVYFEQLRGAMAELARHGVAHETCRPTTSWPPASAW